MELILHELMLEMREALTLWLALIGLAAAAFILFSVSTRPRKPVGRRLRLPLRRSRGPGRRATRAHRAATNAQELRRYADEVAVAASRAAVMARRRHDGWVAMQRTQEAAWRAYEAAEESVRRLSRAAAFPVRDQMSNDPLTFDERVTRARHLARAATAAHARGELSAEQLSDALAHRNGWDPCRHPFEQDAMLRRAAQERCLRAYQEASAIERAAWRSADLAAAAKRSLDDEAFNASIRAWQAERRLPAPRTRRRRLAVVDGRLRVAAPDRLGAS